ncbi:hypothetical protein PoB_003795700, partial [Plakobranchus ocellatus]
MSKCTLRWCSELCGKYAKQYKDCGRAMSLSISLYFQELSLGDLDAYCSTNSSDLFVYIASPHRNDLKLSGLPPGQSAGGGTRTRKWKVSVDLRE